MIKNGNDHRNPWASVVLTDSPFGVTWGMPFLWGVHYPNTAGEGATADQNDACKAICGSSGRQLFGVRIKEIIRTPRCARISDGIGFSAW